MNGTFQNDIYYIIDALMCHFNVAAGEGGADFNCFIYLNPRGINKVLCCLIDDRLFALLIWNCKVIKVIK